MKRILACLIFFVSATGYAQMFPVQREAGITFSSLNSFGLTYRQGRTSKSLWRFNVLSASSSKQDQETFNTRNKSGNSNFTLRFGKEFRAPVSDNFVFRYGLDLSFVYNQSHNSLLDKPSAYSTSTKTVTYGPGANLVLGLNYKIKSIVVGAEIQPNYQYSIGKRTDTNGTQVVKNDVSGSGFGLTSNFALLSVVYAF